MRFDPKVIRVAQVALAVVTVGVTVIALVVAITDRTALIRALGVAVLAIALATAAVMLSGAISEGLHVSRSVARALGLLAVVALVAPLWYVLPSCDDSGVVNGSFSRGAEGWQRVTVRADITGRYPDLGVRGTGQGPAAYLDVPAGTEGRFEQVIRLPSPDCPQELRLVSFKDSGVVIAFVGIYDEGGTWNELDRYQLSNIPMLKLYDLTRFSGQQVRLSIGATSMSGLAAVAYLSEVAIRRYGR